MHFFIDRRQNPKDKSLGNRQRFLRRARARIREVVEQSIRERKIADVAEGERITIPSKGIEEPSLRSAPGSGRRERVFPGNRDYVEGDKIPKPPGGAGGRGRKASDEGEGEDSFSFVLSYDEFLDIFFEDLELPDLIKTDLKELKTIRWRRAGHARTGTAANLNVQRTMRNSIGRRLALGRPKLVEVERLEHRIACLEEAADASVEARTSLDELRTLLAGMERKRKVVAFIDPYDVRYNTYQPEEEPNTKAVMFCLMDVSGSMGEREKDLAKRFFVLLHLFLRRRYDEIDLVFIRHTHEAQEVDEDAFFHSRQTGGTIVSTALKQMLEVVAERYPPNEWNIYAAQASDGENFSSDDARCKAMLTDELMPLVQYYAYVEILSEEEFGFVLGSDNGAALWRAYAEVKQTWRNFAMSRISKPADIFPVFRELFQKSKHRA